MARGGYRPGAGRPKKSASAQNKYAPPPPPVTAKPVEERALRAEAEQKAPLDYMLDVMNDPTVDVARRDRMAIAAAPFVHSRMGEDSAGKREKDAEAARRGAVGKFATPPPPRLIVNNQ